MWVCHASLASYLTTVTVAHPLQNILPPSLRMKKEMVTKVNSVAAEFRKVSDLQMAETTKRAIRENVTINQQMSKMSSNTMDLLRENEALRVKERELKRQLEVLEVNEREMSRRNVSNQKVCVCVWGEFGKEICCCIVVCVGRSDGALYSSRYPWA